MTREVQDLYEKASQLEPEERAELAGLLLKGLEYEVEPGVAEAWVDEVERRMAEYRAGRVKTVPWSELRAHLHRPNR